MHSYRRGDRGPVVAEIRALLAALGLLLAEPGRLGFGDTYDERCDRAVRAFQQRRGLTVDGVVGPETYRGLDEARWRLGDRLLSYVVSRPYVGDDVAALQDRLTELGFDAGRIDGVFGVDTERALREFQRDTGLPPDGTCGPETLRALRRLGRIVVGGSPRQLRERELLASSGPALTGKTVVIDPGHGGDDTGVVVAGLAERDLVADLGDRIEGRLSAAGVTALRTHSGLTRSTAERADFANSVAADLFVSLHAAASPSPRCEGLATYYFGTAGGGGSATGERLADLTRRELAARTGLIDGRSHPKTWELLRLTRMPAIRVDVGYLTNPGDLGRLVQPEFRDLLAEAILIAVQRLYLPEDADVTTGSLRMSALVASQ